MFLQKVNNQAIHEDHLHELRTKGITQIQYACSFLIFAMSVATIVESKAAISEGHQSILLRIRFPIFTIVVASTLKMLMKKYDGFHQYAPLVLSTYGLINITEREIYMSPNQFSFPYPLISLLGVSEYFNIVLFTSLRNKIAQNVIMWTYFVLRNYYQYNYFPHLLIVAICILQTFRIRAGKIIDQYAQNMVQIFNNQNQILNECFKSTLELIPNGILLLNVEDKEISYANQELMNILGIEVQENIIQQLQEFRLSDSLVHDNSLIRSVQKDNKVSSSAYQEQEAKSRLNLWEYLVSSLTNPQSDNNSNLDAVFKKRNPNKHIQIKISYINNKTQVLVIFSDISRIKELQSTAHKMRSMFFSSVAHELRTPLNSIIPMVKLVLSFDSLDLTVQRFLKIILNSSLHLQNVIEDALDMSRIENNNFQIYKENFDLRKAIDEVSQIMEFQIEQKLLKFEVTISLSVPSVIFSDQKRFKQILFNLIGNAIKFTFNGGIEINIDFMNNHLISKVKDTGIGIKEENIDKLFKFFGQIGKSHNINRGGMGLGLTISKMIVQQLNGEISVESIYQQGSTFSFSIPIEHPITIENDLKLRRSQMNMNSFYNQHHASESNQVAGGRNTQQEERKSEDSFDYEMEISKDTIYTPDEAVFFEDNPLHHNIFKFINSKLRISEIQQIKQFKVLIVDDSPYNLFVLKELLKRIENVREIDSALNGQLALDKIKINIGIGKKCSYDLIFLDLHMPILDGFQTIEILREMHIRNDLLLDETRVIALSALTEQQFKTSQNSNLFDLFMEKPINYEVLRQLFL